MYSALETAQKSGHRAREIVNAAEHRLQELTGKCADKPENPELCDHQRRKGMLNLPWAVAVILFVAWMLGLALNCTAGGLIHVLLVVAGFSVFVRIILGRELV